MVTVILTFECKDFESWKIVFDADEARRTNAGLTLSGIYTTVESPNHVTLIFDAESVEGFSAMMTDPELAEKMQESGVMGPPTVSILNKV